MLCSINWLYTVEDDMWNAVTSVQKNTCSFPVFDLASANSQHKHSSIIIQRNGGRHTSWPCTRCCFYTYLVYLYFYLCRQKPEHMGYHSMHRFTAACVRMAKWLALMGEGTLSAATISVVSCRESDDIWEGWTLSAFYRRALRWTV